MTEAIAAKQADSMDAANPPEQRDELTEAALRRVGQILRGRWRLDSLLGVGGTAAVYAATHRNGNRVAIKVLHAHVSLDQAVTSRLQQEGYAANLVEHPGAVRILDDDCSEDGSVFLVMELLYGEGLDMRLRRKGWQLPQAEVLGIGFCVLDVLAAAHAKGVIHRDIKPDNVFITTEGHIKVLDFGIARLLEVPEGVDRSRTGALFGTLGFMAPEQAMGQSDGIDPAIDIWAVGATLFTLLTGRLVHEAVSPTEQLVKAATEQAPPLASVLPNVDPALAALVDRALAFDRSQRWQSAVQMQDAVRALAESTAGPNEQPILQGPRLSVELDVPVSSEFRGWMTPLSLRVSPRDNHTRTLVISRGRSRPWKTVAGVALVCALAGAAFVQRTMTGKSPAPVGTRSEILLPVDLATVTQVASSGPGSSKATTAVLSSADTEPPTAAVPAAAGNRPSLALAATASLARAGHPNELKSERRPRQRRLARGIRRTTRASISDDDALWGRRH